MTHQQWVEFYNKVTAMAARIEAMRTERAYAIARAVGLPANPGLIHNATCDVNLRDWCKGNPAKLKAAKRADRILKDFSASLKARAITQRAFSKVVR